MFVNYVFVKLNCKILWIISQEVIDVLSFELPKSVSKFAGVSSQCLEIADSIIDRFIKTCSPRDMLSILCEVSLFFFLIFYQLPIIIC